MKLSSSKPFILALVSGMIVLSACASRNDPITTSPGVVDAPSTADDRINVAPPEERQNSITWQLVNNDDFQTLTRLIQASGLSETLAQNVQYTVFAPTDRAFESLPAGTLEQLQRPENRKQLEQLISYHIVPAKVTSTSQASEINTLTGAPVTIQIQGDQVQVNRNRATEPSIQATNGIIYPINSVLLPPEFSLTRNN
ncbi:fasciclin domain-containing protein [Leptolyngbya sp. AN03gr2]|uniref:fasciclin domain-containing protein n=1 Tax=unclassified Leptolyngbya TaxID=2650499 RepID=UPI003D315A61